MHSEPAYQATLKRANNALRVVPERDLTQFTTDLLRLLCDLGDRRLPCPDWPGLYFYVERSVVTSRLSLLIYVGDRQSLGLWVGGFEYGEGPRRWWTRRLLLGMDYEHAHCAMLYDIMNTM